MRIHGEVDALKRPVVVAFMEKIEICILYLKAN